MKEIIQIDGKNIELQTNALVPIIYKKNFQKDFFAAINNMQALGFDFVYEITWVFAKIANTDIPDFEEWLGEFEYFPLVEIQDKIIDLVLACISQKNVKTATVTKKNRAKK